MKSIVSTAFAALLAACSAAPEPTATTKNVFGYDDREAVTSSDSPWSAIGKLSTGCTGTLIGRRLVLTAAHCVLDRGSWLASDFYFYPNYRDGYSAHSSRVEHVWYGTLYPSTYTDLDWAILLLDSNLGDVYGWVAVQSYDFYVGDYISVAGYSGDFRYGLTAGVHRDCRVQGGGGGLVYHDCDTSRGSSGGPTFGYFDGEYKIVGINVAEYRNNGEESLRLGYYEHAYANVSIPVSGFMSTLLDVYRTYR